MAESTLSRPATQFTALDLMISGTNTIYKAVPFTVVGDWIQQGRLLPNDQARPAGTSQWRPLAETPLLAPYFPKPEPNRAEDQAEALEPVETGLGGEQEYEEEVDMVPLIDVSLVLLIFFMMTTSGIMALSLFETPNARHATPIVASNSLIIGVRFADGKVEYFLGDEGKNAMSLGELLAQVQNRNRAGGLPDVIIKAAPKVPYRDIQELTVGLQKNGIRHVRAGVQVVAGDDQ